MPYFPRLTFTFLTVLYVAFTVAVFFLARHYGYTLPWIAMLASFITGLMSFGIKGTVNQIIRLPSDTTTAADETVTGINKYRVYRARLLQGKVLDDDQAAACKRYTKIEIGYAVASAMLVPFALTLWFAGADPNTFSALKAAAVLAMALGHCAILLNAFLLAEIEGPSAFDVLSASQLTDLSHMAYGDKQGKPGNCDIATWLEHQRDRLADLRQFNFTRAMNLLIAENDESKRTDTTSPLRQEALADVAKLTHSDQR